MLLVNSMMNKLLEYFMKKNYKRLYNKNFRIGKVKGINYMSNGKVMIVHLIVGLVKKT